MVKFLTLNQAKTAVIRTQNLIAILSPDIYYVIIDAQVRTQEQAF